MSTRQEKRQVYKVFTIVEKPGLEKGIWLEMGVANRNRDGSLSVKLDALPVSGMLHIREHEPKTKRPSGQEMDRRHTAEWRS